MCSNDGLKGLNAHAFGKMAFLRRVYWTACDVFFYTRYSEEKHRNDIEIDFLISNNSKLKYKSFPIEVKSGKRYTTKSLTKFKEAYGKRMGGAYIIHPKNLSIKDDIICIPPYMTMCL